MKRATLLFLVVVILLGGALWFELRGVKQLDQSQELSPEPTKTTPQVSEAPSGEKDPLVSKPEEAEYPKVTTEVVNGRTERTIHMGVRQYAWDPSTLLVKKGELVRLVIHNADVMHGIVIPELGIMEGDIPPEGAVIEFTPDKVGTFEFFCSVYCGEGHMEMRGKVIVE